MLGYYLAQFSWRRLCTIRGVDPFDQILSDIGEYYDPNEWRSFGDKADSATITTERKQRLAFRKGVSLVRVNLWFIVCYDKCVFL